MTMNRLTIALLALPLAACTSDPVPNTPAQQASDVAAVTAEIEGNVDEMLTAFNGGDAATVASHFAEDTRVMFHGTPNMDATQNRDALRLQVADPALELQVSNEEIDVAEAGDMALYTAQYSYRFTDPNLGEPKVEKGNWAMVFMRQSDGSMKVYRDIVADLPPADGAAAAQ